MLRFLAYSISFSLMFCLSFDALACGASCPIVVPGSTTDEVEQPTTSNNAYVKPYEPEWRVRVSAWTLSSTLLFSKNTPDHSVEQRSVALGIEKILSKRLVWQWNIGAIADGSLRAAGRTFQIQPGLVTSTVAVYRFVDAKGAIPFVLGSAAFSALITTTKEDNIANPHTDNFTAWDLRLGITAGTTFFKVLSPYITGRVFGGPVYWTYNQQRTTGTDRYHYQVAAGLSAFILKRIELYAEGAPLGEKRLSAGIGLAFLLATLA